ncbi:MAG TPA: DUF6701 domain-containing protein, partial [Gallionella sp.]|nr:DUF6701 domain-containing protein [Gallionella sp.]
TTANYSGALWKLANTDVSQIFGYTLTPASIPGLTATIGLPVVATNNDGTGMVTANNSDTLVFTRDSAIPQATFTANITNTISVQDASENVVAGNGIISTAAPLVFDGDGAGIAFDAGNEFRYGRLKLFNTYGSELLKLSIPIQTQYWNGAAFVPNVADNCTTLAASNIRLIASPAGVNATVGGAFSSGMGSLVLSKPATPAKVSVNLCVDLGADPVGGTVCSATASANLPYLQGLWMPGGNYTNDPSASATFGVYKGNNEFIYLRENY